MDRYGFDFPFITYVQAICTVLWSRCPGPKVLFLWQYWNFDFGIPQY